jgi:pantothenate kinase-related protein Tda10
MPKNSFRGQGTKCKGKLTVTLSGPKGSGKSLVAKVLRVILPLLMVDEIEIVITPDDDVVNENSPIRDIPQGR